MIKEFFLDILFPKFCFRCGKEGEYLCPDCFSLIDILEKQYCPFCSKPKIVFNGKTCSSCQGRNIEGLYCATSYKDPIVRELISQFKYYGVKDISKPLAALIVAHFLNLENNQFISDNFILVPTPLHKKKLKERGFNQSEELGKVISTFLNKPLKNVLIKIKPTSNQVGLTKDERKENLKGVFRCSEHINKKVLLIDDVFTTGSTMEECAKTLKESGAKEVWGVTVSRGE